MGNSNGTLADHWEAIESTPGLQGGFIWEFWDHGILQRVNDGRPAGRGGAALRADGVAAPGHRWAHGGDFGEAVHDGAFIADGVVFPDRTPKPVMFEHREIAAPVRLTYARDELRVTNHQHFRGLEWLAAEWRLSLADGGTLTAPAELPRLRAGASAVVRPQESGGRHGVRRFTLSAPDATGLTVALDAPRQVSVTRYRAEDLATATHHDELVPRPGCVVHLDAAHRGLGTASCGPDTSPEYLVPPGTHRWSWTLRVL